MRTLIRFAQWWNSQEQLNSKTLGALTQEDQLILVRMLNVYQQLCEEKGATFRMSAMGKPVIELAYNLFEEASMYPSRSLYWVISMGIYGELLIKKLMKLNGFKYTNDQQEVKLGPMVGHIDGVVDGTTVFDIKFMSHSYFMSFTSTPDDERGYLTQLSLYRKALKLPKACFLCINKTTGQAKVVRLRKRDYVDSLLAVKDKLAALRAVRNVDDVFTLKPPMPKLVTRGVNKGKYTVPACMKYSNYVQEIYGGAYYVDVEYFQNKWKVKL